METGMQPDLDAIRAANPVPIVNYIRTEIVEDFPIRASLTQQAPDAYPVPSRVRLPPLERTITFNFQC